MKVSKCILSIALSSKLLTACELDDNSDVYTERTINPDFDPRCAVVYEEKKFIHQPDSECFSNCTFRFSKDNLDYGQKIIIYYAPQYKYYEYCN